MERCRKAACRTVEYEGSVPIRGNVTKFEPHKALELIA